jgi:uncharacterized protein YpmS
MPKEQMLIIFAFIFFVVAAIVLGVRANNKKKEGEAKAAKAAKAATESKLNEFVGVPLAQQLAPPGGFTFEQMVVLGESR